MVHTTSGSGRGLKRHLRRPRDLPQGRQTCREMRQQARQTCREMRRRRLRLAGSEHGSSERMHRRPAGSPELCSVSLRSLISQRAQVAVAGGRAALRAVEALPPFFAVRKK